MRAMLPMALQIIARWPSWMRCLLMCAPAPALFGLRLHNLKAADFTL
jgi:hypothetical protein